MISSKIVGRILVIGPDIQGQGGISSVIAAHRTMFEDFHYMPLTGKGSAKFISPIKAILKSLKRKNRYDVVHIHSASYKDFYRNTFFIYWFKLLGKRVILHMHGAKFDEFFVENKNFVKKVCRKSDLMLGVSSYYVDFFKKNVLNDNICLLHNSVTPSQFIKEFTYEKNNKKIFTYLGALDERKGIFETLEAIGRHKKKFEDIIELHIGGNGDIERLNSLIKRYSLEKIVFFHGWLDNTQKKDLLSKTDVFIHPSISESFGISILEAMDYGLPIITTKVGGIPDLVADGVNGIIVEPGEVDDIANAMERLMNDYELRKSLGEESKKKASEFYHEAIEKQLEAIYIAFMKEK